MDMNTATAERPGLMLDDGRSTDSALTRAPADERDRTHMIDGERASRRVACRRDQGPLPTWEDVKRVCGFDDGLVERLQQSGFSL